MSSERVDKSRALLPKGFEDLLPPLAEKEALARRALLYSFSLYGYDLVKPPLMEFEACLFAEGPGEALQDYSFRVMDPGSCKMMGLRPDTTAQIARIASTRLAEVRPLRLMYANDVLRTRGSESNDLRQYCQVGLELIGADHVAADVEVIVIAVAALHDLGLKNLTVDLSVPKFVDAVLEGFDLSDEDKKRLRDILNMRDVVALAEFDAAVSQVLGGLLDASLESVGAMALSEEAAVFVSNVSDVYEGVHKALGELGIENVTVSIDFCENIGFEFHDGVCFSVFAEGAQHEVCRGGRYSMRHVGSDVCESASGFTVSMNHLRVLLDEPEKLEQKSVGLEESWGLVRELQQQGLVVRRKLA